MAREKIKKYICFFLLLSYILSAAVFPVHAFCEESVTVRVGWHEAPYYFTDQLGRRFGYSYEYQQKIAAYTGWNYEYVEGSWAELMQMLLDGEIDLMANVSYTKERAQSILYASLPMGTEAYYVFVSPDNTEISSDDYASLNGKKIGVAKGTIQSGLFREWAEAHNIQADLTETTGTEEESLLLLGTQLDAFITMDVNADPKKAVPVWKIGSSDFYFALSGKRSDLLPQLNAAMSRIQDENIYYSQQLNEKYLKNVETNLYLSLGEKEWLQDHGTIRVGYQDNYMAFCAKDANTGKLIGTLNDYLEYASTAFENAQLTFEAIAYPTASAAIEALQNGEIDCMFPANLIAYDAESLGVVMTPTLMKTEMDAVVRASDQKEFIRKDQVTVAVNRGNTNYELFLMDHFPSWKINYYLDTHEGLEAVAAGKSDCVIISNYRYNNIAKLCKKLNLTTVYTGVDMDYYFAVRKGDTQLYSILARTTAVVPASTIHAALTYYSTADAKTSFLDYLKEHIIAVLLGFILVVLLILLLLVRSIRAERKATKEERLINDLNKQVFTDALTHVRNKGSFDKYIQQLQEQINQDEKLAVAIGVFDCDSLKTINDKHGHDKGNEYLKNSCKVICTVFQHSPVFRIGGDEFSVVLMGRDFENRDALMRQFQEEQREISAKVENEWEIVSIASGVAVYDPKIDQSIQDLFRRADQLMYENKHFRKENRNNVR
ncbi:MAG: transporter substrate-binding domain-containing protein [Clostridia bacterium]|nr:transporter substrate-binding domain-containing protein [Clostridia bacterium]